MSQFPYIHDSRSGAATVVEYSIVLPIVVVGVLLLVLLGGMTYEKAQVEAATERAALYISKTVSDLNYKDITELNDDFSEINRIAIGKDALKAYPYRYLFGALSDRSGQYENEIANMVRANQLIRNEDVTARVKITPGLTYKVKVDVKEKFQYPQMFQTIFGLESFAEITGSSEVYVNQPSEFIRNADYVVDIVKKVADATGVSGKLEGYIDKVKKAIGFFKQNTSGEDG